MNNYCVSVSASAYTLHVVAEGRGRFLNTVAYAGQLYLRRKTFGMSIAFYKSIGINTPSPTGNGAEHVAPKRIAFLKCRLRAFLPSLHAEASFGASSWGVAIILNSIFNTIVNLKTVGGNIGISI